ncbi:MAG: hypothetical protein AAF628_05660 [Planctomycetota bacterium]
MHRRFLPMLSAQALCALVAAGTLDAQSTLALDGRTSVTKLMGSSLSVDITGLPGEVALLLADVSAGPTTILGRNLPLGFTTAFAAIPLGNLSASGDLNVSLALPADPLLHNAQLFFLAATGNPGAPFRIEFSNGADATIVDRNVQLAGRSLGQYPHFDHVRAFNRGGTVEVAVDTSLYPALAGQSGDLYVVASKTRTQWVGDPSLTDVRGGPQAVALVAGGVQNNIFVVDRGTLAGPDESARSADTRIGVGYDVVIDIDSNGRFDPATDLVDGYDDGGGLYVVRDTAAGSTKGSPAAGPYEVTEIQYTGGSFLGQDTYFPSNIASFGKLPLVVVSHGNGHQYIWYDHIGFHLASYGYVVMSHQNNTGPGSHTAADSTLRNTEYLLANQGSIGGGVLDGHIDETRIIWIGHSRGGDGVARAYDKLVQGTFTPTQFQRSGILLISSIAPVDFGGWSGTNPWLGGTGNGSHPHDVPSFHLWVAQADADVHGCSGSDWSQWYHLHERATRARHSTSLYGVGHGDYHDGGGSSVASGPNLIGRANTHRIMLGYLLPLVKHRIEGDAPSRDFLWRQYESFRPVGAPVGANVVANLMFQDDAQSGKYVIDDFQDIQGGSPTPGVASSGAGVTRTVGAYSEGRADDGNSDFSHNPGDAFNGFTHDEVGTGGHFRSESYGSVFSVDGERNMDITYDLTTATARPDFRGYEYLSFRAAQGTRHVLTTAQLADINFDVMLEDGRGNTSTIAIGTYGGGIEDPYQRSGFGCGTGNGWTSEYETIRIRLADFLAEGSDLDLADITKVVFQFGPAHGTGPARLGLDEIELTVE